MINSVCGCSAGSPGLVVLMAVANTEKKPDYLTTSFAGFDDRGCKKDKGTSIPLSAIFTRYCIV